MEKGILHIKNKPRHILLNDKQKIPIAKDIPEIGKECDKLACEFEGNPATKIVVGDVIFGIDENILKAKEEAKKQAEEAEKQRLEAEKQARKAQSQVSATSSSKHKKPDSFDIREAFTPKYSDALIQTITNHSAMVDNFNLKLNKFARYISEKDKFFFFKNDRKENRNTGQITGHNFEIDAHYGDTNFGDLTKRQLSLAQKITQKQESFLLKPDWRLALGLGIESVYETSICLHHIYGIPYIPASGIKGIVRSWVITEKFGTAENAKEQKDFPFVNAEFRALTESREFCEIFGCPKDIQPVEFDNGKPIFKKKDGKETKEYKMKDAVKVALKEEHQGKLIFFDAFPTSAPKIEVDIMNPHYPDYYKDADNKKGVAPTDYQSPLPIPFLTVSGCAFQFIIGVRNAEDKPLLDKAKEWLEKALTEHGIGAKTAVGYGYMQ